MKSKKDISIDATALSIKDFCDTARDAKEMSSKELFHPKEIIKISKYLYDDLIKESRELKCKECGGSQNLYERSHPAGWKYINCKKCINKLT